MPNVTVRDEVSGSNAQGREEVMVGHVWSRLRVEAAGTWREREPCRGDGRALGWLWVNSARRIKAVRDWQPNS